MTGRKYKRKETDEVCETCGLVYSRRGIIPHSRNCDRDEPILDPGRDARHPSMRDEGEGEDEGEAPDPSDGVGVGASDGSPVPEDEIEPDVDDDRPDAGDAVTTDGGRAAPPEPDIVTDGGDRDQDDVDEDDDGCPKCGDEGIALEDVAGESPILAQLAERYDRLCPDCSTEDTAEVW